MSAPQGASRVARRGGYGSAFAGVPPSLFLFDEGKKSKGGGESGDEVLHFAPLRAQSSDAFALRGREHFSPRPVGEREAAKRPGEGPRIPVLGLRERIPASATALTRRAAHASLSPTRRGEDEMRELVSCDDLALA